VDREADGVRRSSPGYRARKLRAISQEFLVKPYYQKLRPCSKKLGCHEGEEPAPSPPSLLSCWSAVQGITPA